MEAIIFFAAVLPILFVIIIISMLSSISSRINDIKFNRKERLADLEILMLSKFNDLDNKINELTKINKEYSEKLSGENLESNSSKDRSKDRENKSQAIQTSVINKEELAPTRNIKLPEALPKSSQKESSQKENTQTSALNINKQNKIIKHNTDNELSNEPTASNKTVVPEKPNEYISKENVKSFINNIKKTNQSKIIEKNYQAKKQEIENIFKTAKSPSKSPINKQQNEESQLTNYFKENSIEDIFFGNIILKVSILAFILGIGFFLKYSIDKDWLPIWGRVLIGIVVGISLLVGGIKMITNKQKLFSEGLFGAGIAVLYLSSFAAVSIEGFIFISTQYAYVAMIFITILAGIISVKFDAKSTAIFGLIGGFATPMLLSTGSHNYIGLLTYMLILNLGVLFISVYKKWTLLPWLAFIITTATTYYSIKLNAGHNFIKYALLIAAFFIIYSIAPFINQIRREDKNLKPPQVLLFWINFISVVLSYLILFKLFNIKLLYYSAVSIPLAAYMLVYAGILSRKKVFLKNLFYSVLGQAVALLLVTPALIFDGSILTIVWSVESFVLLWIFTKTKEVTYAGFGFFGFALVIFKFLFMDLMITYSFYIDMNLMQIRDLAITSFFVIAPLFTSYYLLKGKNLNFKFIENSIIKKTLFIILFALSFFVLAYLNTISKHLYTDSNIISMIYMLIIAIFAFLLSKSFYAKKLNFIFDIFVLMISACFIYNICIISEDNLIIATINFILFMSVFALIYNIHYKGLNITVSNHNLSDAVLALGIFLVFVFLNTEIYHLVRLFTPEGTKFAITILWVIFGIGLFSFGYTTERKNMKMAAIILISTAILKAFFFDLTNLNSIYRIVLLLILGPILFALSYFYLKKSEQKTKLENNLKVEK